MLSSWRMYEMHLVLSFKTGCDRSGIRGMLTVGRNLDRNGQTLTYLPSSNSFYTYLTLILSILILIMSHLPLFYSDDSYLFYSETRWISHLGIPTPMTFLRDRKHKTKLKLFSLLKMLVDYSDDHQCMICFFD
jgi:hypothetical protein